MNDGQKAWLDSLTVEALERFSEGMMAVAENGEDKERQRFYEGMAVASKLAAMKLKGEFEYIDETLIRHMYENMKMLNVVEINDTFVTAQENMNERCSFCLREKARLARGPLPRFVKTVCNLGCRLLKVKNDGFTTIEDEKETR